MKTLVEVEPRIAINDENTPGGGTSQYEMRDPGSYDLTQSDNRIEGNTLSDNDCGIEVDDSGNLIVRNSATGHSPGNDYVIAPNNDLGTVQTAPVGAGAWDNFDF